MKMQGDYKKGTVPGSQRDNPVVPSAIFSAKVFEQIIQIDMIVSDFEEG
jgi:hypothetical protein